MTCFWNAIEQALTNEDRTLLGMTARGHHGVISALKKINTPVTGLIWQGKYLTPKYAVEAKEAVRAYDANTALGGYLTSACDPFLCILASALSVNITFFFNSNRCDFQVKRPRKRLEFGSTSSHFYYKATHTI